MKNTFTNSELPTYQCHKKVKAAKILFIEMGPLSNYMTLENVDPDKEPVIITVTSAYLDKHKPVAGGYYVIYEDNYESFSPAANIDSGYSLIKE